MTTRNQKIHGIIHVAATATAGVGAGMSQAPGSDTLAIVPLQTAMIVAIGAEHGVKITKGAAADILLTFSASMTGRAISQWLVGWIPGFGNVINAATAFSLTETIGWVADAYFDESVIVK